MEILAEMQVRILKSFLDVLILAQLRKEPKSAYDLILFIHKKFRLLMSSGTVYATLYSMERDGLIQANWSGRKRVYTLTDKGQKTILAFLNTYDRLQRFLPSLVSDTNERII